MSQLVAVVVAAAAAKKPSAKHGFPQTVSTYASHRLDLSEAFGNPLASQPKTSWEIETPWEAGQRKLKSATVPHVVTL